MAGRDSVPGIALGALVGSVRHTPDDRRVVEVRNAVVVPTVYYGARYVPDPAAWHDVEMRYPAGADGQPRLVGWFYTDAALRTDPPRVDVASAHRATGLEAGVLLLVDPTNEEGAFFVRSDDAFARVEATRMKSDVARLAVGVPGWPIAPWNSDFPGAPPWLAVPAAPEPAWLDDPLPAGGADSPSPQAAAGLTTPHAAAEQPPLAPYMGPPEVETHLPAAKEAAPATRDVTKPHPAPNAAPETAAHAKLPTIAILPPEIERAGERSRRDMAVLGICAVLALVVLVLSNPGLFQAERETRLASPTALVAEAIPASPTAVVTRVSEALGMEGPVEAVPPSTPTAMPTEAPTPVPPPPDTPTSIPEPTREPPSTEPPAEVEPPTAVPPRPVPPTSAPRRAAATPVPRAPRPTSTRRPPTRTATPVIAAATVPVPIPADTPAPPPDTPVPPTSVAANTPPVPTSPPVPPPPTNTPVPAPPTSTPPPTAPQPPLPTSTPAPTPPPDTPVPQPTSPPPPSSTPPPPPPPPPTDTPVPVEPTATSTTRPVVDATNTPRPIVDPTDTPTPPAGGGPYPAP